ncbi:MAG: SLBB domain-containing protein [Endomicrobiales bacterium]
MKKKNPTSIYFFFSFLIASFFLCCLTSPSHSGPLTAQTLKNDLHYYHTLAKGKKLDSNDRYYVLLRIEDKYRKSGVDMDPLRREMRKLKKDGAATVSSPAPRAHTAKKAAPAGEVRKILVSETREDSRVVITAEGVTRHNSFTLKDPAPGAPPKVVLDLYGVKDKLSDAARDIKTHASHFSHVYAEQIGAGTDSAVRIVAVMRSERPFRVRNENNQWLIVSDKEAPQAVLAAETAPAPAAAAVAVAVAAAAVPGEKTAPPEKTSAFDNKNYTMEAGDVLGISIYPADELSREAVVQQDGKISFPLIGSAQAQGLTPGRLEQSLEKNLARFISAPQVTVTVKQFSRRQVFVTGQIRSVGAYPYKENLRLLEFISSAGGFTESANRKEVKVYRGPSEKRRVFTVNVEDIVRSGDFSKDFLLEPGDIIEVAKGQARVAILGDVRSPGYYDYRENLQLLELVSLAGGFTETAQINTVNVLHPDTGKGQSVTKVNLTRILSGNDRDVEIASGDTVYIPKKALASANWFINNILPWLSLVSLVLVIRGGI